jgi:CheY-like chemotaxis protein
VSSGEDAVGKVIQNDYDLITLDIYMAGISGLAALAVIRTMRPHALIALIFGRFEEVLPTDVAYTADVMIRKPVSVSTIRGLVDAAFQIRNALKSAAELG